jgi:hypothetical protein
VTVRAGGWGSPSAAGDRRSTRAGGGVLSYLLGDVLRIYAGDFQPGQVGGLVLTQAMWLGVAVLMAVPIIMLVLSLLLDQPINRVVNIIAAIGLFAFNVVGLPGYPGVYDKFLNVFGLVLNAMTVYIALRWE